MTTDQSTVQGRREFYAAVALTDLPMPLRVSFRVEREADAADVTLVFDSITLCRTWAQAVGADLGDTWRDGVEEVACCYGVFANWKIPSPIGWAGNTGSKP
jgi:hypothetical protein